MINNVAKSINAEDPWNSVVTAMHANEGLMGISALKQYINLQGLMMPSMNYTHYVRFARHPQVVLEWLLNCNFLPLFFTGNTTDAEEACNAQYFLDNLADDIEGVHERYPIANHDFDAYKALIPASKITPHMILDFRGMGLGASKVGHDIVSQYVNEVCNYVKGVQDQLLTYGTKWDIEKNHNPMITVLTDDDAGNSPTWINDDVSIVHCFDAYESAKGLVWGWGTAVKTYVRVYTNDKN